MIKKIKVKLNYLLDRLIDRCDMILMDTWWISMPVLHKAIKRTARAIGNASWLLRAFPRQTAFKLTGQDWTLVFCGPEHDLVEISALFFQGPVEQEQIGRVALWKLQKQAQRWLDEGIDLVICGLACTTPYRPKTEVTFTVPNWIHQSLALPENLDHLLKGKLMSSVRHNLNRAAKSDFSWYFGTARQDFDAFHYHMYKPYISERHGERALIAPYQDQWDRWFTKGGLLMITQENRPVGGQLCYIRGDTCFCVEVGVLDNDPTLFNNGIRIANDWFAIQWAHQQGARVYDMGGTRPWCSDGVFTYKSRWRTRVVQRKRVYGTWTFLAQDLTPPQQAYINKLGLIAEQDSKFYAIQIQEKREHDTNDDQHDLDRKRAKMRKRGLDGIVVISPHAAPLWVD